VKIKRLLSKVKSGLKKHGFHALNLFDYFFEKPLVRKINELRVLPKN